MEKPVLRGKKVVLRPITEADAEAMFAGLGDEEGMRLTGTQETFTLEQVRAFCARVAGADDRLDYAVTLPDDPRYRGEVVVNDIDWKNKAANFRIAMNSPDNRDKGYGSEAAALILEHVFERLELHRLELEVFAFNARARHVYRKLGFQREGVRRDALLWEGEYHDAVMMSLLKADYRNRKTAPRFEAIATDRLVIRRLRHSDIDAFVTYRNLPEVAWMQLWDSYSEDQARALLRGCQVSEPFTAGDDFQFAVALKRTDELVGDLYFKLDEAGNQAELGYTFAPAFQGQGLATEAVTGLLEHAFSNHALHRVYGITDPRNLPSIRLMKRVGMRQEAHFRKNLWFKGEWADDVVFALLAREWAQRGR